MYIVYKYTFPNGKIYIGKTKSTIEQRAGSNGCRYGLNTLVGRAIHKYGWVNVKKEIVYSNLSKDEANQIERQLIKELNTTNHDIGYNLTSGGDGGSALGHKLSEEAKRRIGEKNRIALKGRKVDPEVVARMRQSLIGHEVSEETREKIRKANTGRHHSEETKRKLSELNKNRSDEVLNKISASLRVSGKQRAEKFKRTMKERYPNGRVQSVESNKKRSEKLKGIKKSEETKQKMRKPKSPEAVENMKKAQRLRREAEKLGLNSTEYKTRMGN